MCPRRGDDSVPGADRAVGPLLVGQARQVAEWVREVAGLETSLHVHVAERTCVRSGWPPLEVVIRHDVGDAQHEHTIHKRLAAITRLDVQAAWRGGDSCCS